MKLSAQSNVARVINPDRLEAKCHWTCLVTGLLVPTDMARHGVEESDKESNKGDEGDSDGNDSVQH